MSAEIGPSPETGPAGSGGTRPASTGPDPTGPDPAADGPLDALTRRLAARAARGRPAREALARLAEGEASLDDLVDASALPRRSVEELLADAGPDVVTTERGFRLAPGRAAAYRERFDLAGLAATALPDPLAARLADAGETLAWLTAAVEAAPAPDRDLDHVAATPLTVLRRALWLDSTFDLAGARVLCLGDHDLTSLALARVSPAVEITVVDVDERILDHIAARAGAAGPRVRCLFGDLRQLLPPSAAEWADLVVTDPPYTPEGVGLFLSQALRALRDRDGGRIIMAYGFSERQPTLGLKTQEAVSRLGLAYEAILPNFNRYRGARAIGAASDLYVCAPTSRSWTALSRLGPGGSAIYTHGARSVEARPPVLEQTAARVAPDIAAAGGSGVSVLVGDGWPATGPEVTRLGLATLLARGLPVTDGAPAPVVAVNLSADTGPWLARVLLAVNASRLAVLVPNNHPDLTDAAGLARLRRVSAGKYRLSIRRATPDGRHAVVAADAVPTSELSPSDLLVRRLLDRAHGKIGNVWRDALVRAARDAGPAAGRTLTKKSARAIVRDRLPADWLGEVSAVELPFTRLSEVLTAVAASVADLEVPVP